MTLFLNNKFNVIHTLVNDDFDYKSKAINFVENYIESEISIIHPDYLYQISINNKYPNIDEHILIIFKNYLKKIKVNIKKSIKQDCYSIDKGLNKLILNYIHKINYLHSIFKINKTDFFNLFHNIIISDQIVVSFIESHISINNKDIHTLLNNIKIINEENTENYIWFLKLIGTNIRDNIPCIKENFIIKPLYEIKLISKYIANIKSIYHFIGNDTIYIIQPIIEIFMDKIKLLISIDDNFDDFYILFEHFWKDFHYVVQLHDDFHSIKNDIAVKIQKKVKKLNDTESLKIIKLIILLNKFKIAENQLFLLFNNDNILNNVIHFINFYISNYNFNIINDLILLLSNIKNKDDFINKYHNELIKRLLSTHTLISLEQKICNTLINVFGFKEIRKINKCINDYVLSSQNLMNFSTYTFTTTLLTTSYESWNINYNNGFLDKFELDINYSNGLLNFISNYNNYYKSINNKKLLWLLQYGEVIVEYNNYTLKMLPIQLLILELFNFTDSINIHDVLNHLLFVNYQSDYLNNIISSLIKSGLLINHNNILSLTTNVNNTDLISSYYNCNNIEPSQNIVTTDIVHSRRDIVTTWINHFTKKNNKTFDQLFTEISSVLTLFSLDKTILQDAIDYMIKYDYIRKDNEYYIKIYY